MRVRTRVAGYFALTKPRVVAMILVTTLAGFYLGSDTNFDFVLASRLLLGTALAAGGTLALNQYLERESDALMHRTRTRPLPGGRLAPIEALAFGVAAVVSGLVVLSTAVNLLTAAVVLATTLVYLFAYTPLKRVSWICNPIGAIPGALPPVAGWTAAKGTVGVEAIVLFAIMFLWQLPHSLAIARLYRIDYERAGMRLLPAEDLCGNKTDTLIVANCIALIVAAALPTLMGFAGLAYLVIAALLGLAFLFLALRLRKVPTMSVAARRLVLASVIYLPVVLLALVLDRV
jgi:protoheme IX farnesyltransferase